MNDRRDESTPESEATRARDLTLIEALERGDDPRDDAAMKALWRRRKFARQPLSLHAQGESALPRVRLPDLVRCRFVQSAAETLAFTRKAVARSSSVGAGLSTLSSTSHLPPPRSLD
jgi:hypothetical protein